jgi:hypothetical protein
MTKQWFLCKTLMVILLLGFTSMSIFCDSGVKLTTFPDLSKPRGLYVTGQRLVISENHTIYVHNLDSLTLTASFGRKGEGPGEFKTPPTLMILKDHIFADHPGKSAYFSFDGKLVTELKKTNRGIHLPIKENIVFLKTSMDFKKRTIPITVIIKDKELNPIKEISRGEKEGVLFVLSSDTGKETRRMTPHYFGVEVNRHYIFVGDSTKGFHIEKFDEQGNKIKTITLETEKVKVSQQYKDRRLAEQKELKYWQKIKNNHFLFYPFFPAIKDFSVDDHFIYVKTHKTDKQESQFIILDLDGKLLKKVLLPTKEKLYCFHKGTYYYLSEDEDRERWILFKIEVL